MLQAFKINFHSNKTGSFAGNQGFIHVHEPFSLQATESGLGRQKAEELGQRLTKGTTPKCKWLKTKQMGLSPPILAGTPDRLSTRALS